MEQSDTTGLALRQVEQHERNDQFVHVTPQHCALGYLS
jgi:hypothetical protein